MKLELFLSYRYFIAKKRSSSVSLVSTISIVSVASAVMFLIVVFSVLNGFHDDMKSKILSKEYHINIVDGRSDYISDYRGLVQKISNIRGLRRIIPRMEGQGLLNFRSSTRGVKIRGVVEDIWYRDPDFGTKFQVLSSIKETRRIEAEEFKTRILARVRTREQRELLLRCYRYDTNRNLYLRREELSTGEQEQVDEVLQRSGYFFDVRKRNHVLIGDTLSKLMAVGAGDMISLYVPPKEGLDDMLLPLNIQYRVSGVFTSGYSEYDEFFVFMSMKDAQFLFGTGDVAYAVGVKIDDYDQAPAFRRKIERQISSRYMVRTWMYSRRNLYTALLTEKALIGLVLFFVVLIAAVAIASTLVMVVMEKEREIGILKSMGMRPQAVMSVFILQGFMIGILGTVLGLFAGLAIATSVTHLLRAVEWLVNTFSNAFYSLFHGILALDMPSPWVLFPKDVYYVTTFPAKINFPEVFIICLLAVLITTLCALIPAWYAARLRVTEVLHKE